MHPKVLLRIFKKHRTAKALRQSEEKFSKTFSLSPAAMSLHDLSDDRRYIDVNLALQRITGYSYDELVGSTAEDLRIFAEPEFRRHIAGKMASGEPIRNLEYKFRKKNGDIGVGLLSVELIELDGRPHALSSTVDITERKKIEEDVANRLRFETFLTDLSSRFVNTRADRIDEEIRQAQQAVCEWFGLDISSLWQKSQESPRSFNLTHFWSASTLEPPQSSMESSEYFPWIQHRQQTERKIIAVSSIEELPPEAGRDREIWERFGIKSALIIPLAVEGKIAIGTLTFNSLRENHSWPEELVNRLRIVAQIFTHALLRKRSDQALRDSEARFRFLLKDIPSVAVQSYGPDGTTRYWNKASEHIYGYSEKEALGRNLLDLIIPPEMREAVKNDITLMSETGRAIPSSELSLMRRDGSRVTVFSSHIIVRVPGNEPELFCIDIDLTEQKQAEEKLRCSLTEKEILLRELYHRTKNNMQVLISMLNLQTESIEDPKTLSVFRNAQNRIHTMAMVHQMLYDSGDLSSIDIRGYIVELAELLRTSFKVSPDRVRFVFDVQSFPVLFDIALPCGLIINELVSNSLEHAFPSDRTGEIRIELKKIEGSEIDAGEIELRVSDNGTGAPPDRDFPSAGSMGLRTVVMTAEHQLQGRVEFENNGGVSCRIRFKDSLYEPRV